MGWLTCTRQVGPSSICRSHDVNRCGGFTSTTQRVSGSTGDDKCWRYPAPGPGFFHLPLSNQEWLYPTYIDSYRSNRCIYIYTYTNEYVSVSVYTCLHKLIHNEWIDIMARTVHNQVMFHFNMALPVHVDQEAQPPQRSAAWPSDARLKGAVGTLGVQRPWRPTTVVPYLKPHQRALQKPGARGAFFLAKATLPMVATQRD